MMPQMNGQLLQAGGEAYPPDYDDLARLHALVTKKKNQCLRAGSGKSTLVLADARTKS